ncbi:spermidine synthase [Phenylobacterium aquaticum]|uniref:spermidine synthase n=1 Tax=Phenylobacterium aquaticum TaxID=1763816 RepID=UPI001F5D54E1|nr:fused MFS/spermidine synthase [Phenylobacterium aquaticum]MCI3132706.1 fused MFS/spermidine synthase [Phenylobacterium aquaticum]
MATFISAGLVFLVEPLLAKLMLPLLGGTPAVWNTSLAFFQVALLAGYAYAHGLQRLKNARLQAVIHAGVLILAAATLPLRVTSLIGPPQTDHPAIWLLGALTLSIGAPFAALSATAPLVQAWHARVYPSADGGGPYSLYAASNLGSLLALLAYPTVVEPLMAVHDQTTIWSGLYLVFAGLLIYLAWRASSGAGAAQTETAIERTPAPTWRTRITWLLLAAAPSSLMMGVTNHLSMDVASAPFLWVAPLALYLITFVIAFADKPPIPLKVALLLQAIFVPLCAAFAPYTAGPIGFQILLHLATFFAVALVCHLVLVSKRPAADHLTEFYLWMSAGGVVGGSFNAFLAPILFDNVWEYPIVLLLAGLARPWAREKIELWRWGACATAVALAVSAPLTAELYGYGEDSVEAIRHGLLLGAAILTLPVRNIMPMFVALIAVISVSAEYVGDRVNDGRTYRNFFGVLSETTEENDDLGDIKIIWHGSTVHGAQLADKAKACEPLLYYGHATSMGKLFARLQAEPHPLQLGVVGLGAGVTSTITRPGDEMTYFEINPLVRDLATDPKHFTFLSNCAKGHVGIVMGDARFTVQQQPNAKFDFLMIDAFSSDAIPAHLLTVEAMRIYLAKLKDDGVLLIHISNRNLELGSPALAVAKAAGAVAVLNDYDAPEDANNFLDTGETMVLVAKHPAVLAKYAPDAGWSPTPPKVVRPWTDDYTNLIGALYRQIQANAASDKAAATTTAAETPADKDEATDSSDEASSDETSDTDEADKTAEVAKSPKS